MSTFFFLKQDEITKDRKSTVKKTEELSKIHKTKEFQSKMKITLTYQQTTKTLIHKLGVATSPRGNKINIKGCETIHGSGKQRGGKQFVLVLVLVLDLVANHRQTICNS